MKDGKGLEEAVEKRKLLSLQLVFECKYHLSDFMNNPRYFIFSGCEWDVKVFRGLMVSDHMAISHRFPTNLVDYLLLIQYNQNHHEGKENIFRLYTSSFDL